MAMLDGLRGDVGAAAVIVVGGFVVVKMEIKFKA